MFGIGTTELVVILLVALLVLGPKKLPEIAKSIGKTLGEFRRVTTDVKRTIEMEADQEEEVRAKKKTKKQMAQKIKEEGSLPEIKESSLPEVKESSLPEVKESSLPEVKESSPPEVKESLPPEIKNDDSYPEAKVDSGSNDIQPEPDKKNGTA